MQRQKKKKIPTLHLLMVGNSHVGKSCLMNRHCFGSFNHNHVTVSVSKFWKSFFRFLFLSFSLSHSLQWFSQHIFLVLSLFLSLSLTRMPFNTTFSFSSFCFSSFHSSSHSQTIGIDYKLQRLKVKEIGKVPKRIHVPSFSNKPKQVSLCIKTNLNLPVFFQTIYSLFFSLFLSFLFQNTSRWRTTINLGYCRSRKISYDDTLLLSTLAWCTDYIRRDKHAIIWFGTFLDGCHRDLLCGRKKNKKNSWWVVSLVCKTHVVQSR